MSDAKIQMCCGGPLKTKKDILAHYKQVPFTGDKRPLFGCNTHKRNAAKCIHCKFIKLITKVDHELWKKGKTLSYFREE